MTKICVVGLGYVGLPLACLFSKKYEVIGFDVSKEKIDSLKSGIDPTNEVGDLSNCKVNFTTDHSKINDADFIIVAVSTPIDENNIPDFKYLKSASEIVGKNMKKGSIIVFESTVYPGATEEICLPIIEKESGLKLNVDFKLGYSPERINPGDKEHTVDKILKVVSGSDKEALDKIAEIYGSVITAGVHKAESIKVAEAAKVIENVQRDLNIALMNELSIIFEKIGIDTKAVLEAAGTKWNFHKYTPGLVGGHCFEQNQLFFVKYGSNYFTLNAKEFYEFAKNKKDVEVLSFDVDSKKSEFKKCTAVSKRKYSNIVKIKTSTNQILKVTDDHPVIVWEDGFKVKHAGNISINDKLVVLNKIPTEKFDNKIDLINYLPKNLIEKTRVKPISKQFKDFKKVIKFKENLGKKSSNSYIGNYMSLKDYLVLEKKGCMPIKRDEIYLVSGRGPSFNQIKAVIKLNDNFARLIGYYLSEGCVTKDKSTRVRWTFSGSENNLVNDLLVGISELGLRYSIYRSKKDNAQTVKVSSNIFGFLVKDILKCGKDSYDAEVPYRLFYSKNRVELLKGILRGDGGVKLTVKNKAYVKNGKKDTHKDVSCEVSFFSISKKLFHQTILLLQDYGITASYDLERPLLYIHGHENLIKLKDLFLGEKRRKIEKYFMNKTKFIKSSKYEKKREFNIVGIKEISKEETDYVYSFEVEKTQTLITDYGIIAHNCIGVDPYYLTYKAQKVGYDPQVILAGRKINDSMHEQVVYLLSKGLAEKDKLLKGSKVLVMGLTFKENVPDYRNSRAKQLIKSLKSKGALLYGYDPHLSEDIVENVFDAKYVENLNGKYDAVVLFSPHKKFKLSVDLINGLLNESKVFVDVKGYFDKDEFIGKGVCYYRL